MAATRRPHRPDGPRRTAATSSKRRTILASLAVVAASLVLFEMVSWAVLGPPVRLKATRAGRDVQTAYDVRYAVGADGLRPVCASERDAAAQQAVVSFIGDSFTFGQGVGDQNNFVHLLSCDFADLSFVNFGAIGVGLEYYLEITQSVLPRDARVVFVIMYENDVVAPGWSSTRARIKRFIKANSYLYLIYNSLERWIDLGSASAPMEKVGGKYNNPKSVAVADPDFLRAWTSPAEPALAAFRSAIRDLLDALEDAAPAATIFMAMVPEASTVSRPVREFYRDVGVSFLPTFGVRSETYRAAMEACSGRCRFIDIYPPFLRHGAEVYFDTDFHWNEAGHALMAELLTPYLEGLTSFPEACWATGHRRIGLATMEPASPDAASRRVVSRHRRDASAAVCRLAGEMACRPLCRAARAVSAGARDRAAKPGVGGRHHSA